MLGTTVSAGKWGVNGNDPYFLYSAPAPLDKSDVESWWEIRTERSTSRERPWEGRRFESRIEAKSFWLKNKKEGETIDDVDIRVVTK